MSRDVTIVLSVTDNFSSTLGQFKDDVAGINENSQELGEATEKVDSAFDGMANSITAGIIAFAGWRGIQAVGQMLDLGKSVDVTSKGFDSLTSNIGGSASVLAQLRDATQGATDNMDLMTEANKLLSLNLVDNANDLAHIMGVADDLSDVFGVDAKQGVDAFTKALETGRANSLVQFGIDLDAVKKRTEELKETMNDKEAFRMAVLEQADKTLARFGGAADAAATPIDRVKVSVTNLTEAIAHNVEVGANSTLGILEIATGNYPGQAEAKAKSADEAHNAAADFARQNFSDMTQYLDMAGVQKGSDAFVSKLMSTVAEAIKNNPNADVGKLVADQLLQGWVDGEAVSPNDVQGYIDSFNMVYGVANAEIIANASNQQGKLKKELYAKLLSGDSGREYEKAPDVFAQQYATLLGLPDERQASELAQREATMLQKSRQDAINGISSSMTGAFGTMGYDTSVTDPNMFNQKLDPKYMASLVPDYMEQSGADQVTKDLRSAQAELVKLQDLADQKLISDDQLNSAKNMVDNLSAMADQAQRSADAFKNLSVAQALGQSGGGMKGEMTDMVLAQMKEKGYGKTAMDAMKEQLDLSSGRETNSSEEMKQKIIPEIAKLSAKQAAQALANLDSFLKQATLDGLTDDQITAMMPEVVGFDVEGHSRDATKEEVAAQLKRWQDSHKKDKKTGQYLDKNGKPVSFSASQVGYNTVSGGTDFTGMMEQFIQSQMDGGQLSAGTSAGETGFGGMLGGYQGKNPLTAGSKGGDLPSTHIAHDMTMIHKESDPVAKNMTTISDHTILAQTAITKFRDIMDKIPHEKAVVFKFTADDPQGLVTLVRAILGGGTSLDSIQRDNGQAAHTQGGGV